MRRMANAGGGPAKRASATIITTGGAATKPYDYHDVATLLRDFWKEVDVVLKKRGVIP